MNKDIELLLRKNIEHLIELDRDVWPSLVEVDEISDDALYLVRSIVQNCQSALDWIATAVDRKFGKAADRSPYYPLRDTPERFEEQFARDFAGVSVKAPDIHKVMAFHQPYTRGKGQLALLHDLARVNKHQHFTRQVRQHAKQHGVVIGGMTLFSMTSNEDGTGTFSIGGPPIYGHFTEGGVSYAESHDIALVNGTLVTWKFDTPDLAVQPVLVSLHDLVAYACEDACIAGDL